MKFKRLLHIDKLSTSAFLFGPRMTGKTYLLRELQAALYIDLLDPETELQLKQSPRLFWERLAPLAKGSLVIVDEVQRVPLLLDYVQKGIEELELRFILSGSSARKLRRGGANLLGGRAQDLRLHPLTARELEAHFRLDWALQFGTLPRITQMLIEGSAEETTKLLRSYYTTYIKEEIQAEALTRRVDAFQRFLQVAAQANAHVIEFANIARECSVPMSTVKEYYSILEDTLLGEFLWPWDRSERKKARPKFYFFDCGVVHAIQNRLTDPPTPDEMGHLFETWFIREIIRMRDYLNKPHEFAFWREGTHEVDLLIMRGKTPVLAIECKSGRDGISVGTETAFKKRFPAIPLIMASSHETVPRRLDSGIDILPWKQAIDRYSNLP
jgi:predicted AAA+ superfamily ATPase